MAILGVSNNKITFGVVLGGFVVSVGFVVQKLGRGGDYGSKTTPKFKKVLSPRNIPS